MTQNPNTDPGSGPKSSPGPQGRESAYFWRFSNRVWLKLLSEERRPVKQRDRPRPQPPPPSGHKCVRAVSSAAAGADSYLSRCSRCPGAILHRVPSHKSHRSLRRVSRQINALRSQLRRFPLSTGNTGAPAPRLACGEQSRRLRRCSSRERRTLRLSLPPAADLRSQAAESTTLSKPFQNKAEMTSHYSITAGPSA